MIKRNLCGNEVSFLGMGCMRFPLKDGKVNSELSMKIVDKAIEMGVNYLDTAYVYSDGKNESFINEVIEKYGRSELYIATKLPLFANPSREDYDILLNRQLTNLGTNYIDYYLLHALNKDRFDHLVKNDYKSFIADAKVSGKVKHIGFSFHDSFEVFKTIADDYDWDFCQIQFNYLDAYDQEALKMYEYAHQKGIDVIVMEPLRGGRLTHLPKEVRNKFDECYLSKSDAFISFNYLNHFSGIKVVLSGMRSVDDVMLNVNTFNTFTKITDVEEKCYLDAKDILLNYHTINCTKCLYCKDCPSKIRIADIFEKFNNQIENPFLNEDEVMKWYNSLDSVAKDCIECGMCERNCPQHLKIIDLLKKCDEYFKN